MEFKSKGERQRLYSHGLYLQEFGFRNLGFKSRPHHLPQEPEEVIESLRSSASICKMGLLVMPTSQVAGKIKGNNNDYQSR